MNSRWLLDLFRSLPEQAQLEIMGQLHEAIKWRGYDKSRSAFCEHAVDAVQKIVGIMEQNGHDFEEYT